MESAFKIDDIKCHVSKKPQNSSKSIFLSPVFVKRAEPGGVEKMERYLYNKRDLREEKKYTNCESCTQTSKTIIELAKMEQLEKGYMSPDSLNTSPHVYRAEKDYRPKICENEVDQNVYNIWNSNYDDSRCMQMLQEDSKIPLHSNHESSIMATKNKRMHIFSQKPGNSLVLQENCIGDQKYDTTIWEEGASSKKPQKPFEIWHAQVYNEKITENPIPKAPIVVNIINKKSDKFNKESKSSLIKEFLTSKANKPIMFNNNKVSSLKSHSYVDSNYFLKITERRALQKNESKFNNLASQKLAHFYKTCESKLKEVKEIESDSEVHEFKEKSRPPGSFRRSNSFMSPTLSSQRKSLKHAVDNVKNLVNRTCRERSPTNLSTQYEEEHIIRPVNTEVSLIKHHEDEITLKLNMSDGFLQSVSSIQESTESFDNSILIILGHIKSDDWNCALKGLAEIVDLARNSDPETLMPFMTMINQRLLDLMRSPRSHVCRTACQLAGHLFEHMKDTRRPEFDDIVTLLLSKCADANKFIRQDANLALDTMVTHLPTFHSIRAICMKGPTHRNPLVRCASVRLLICAVVIAGPDVLLTNSNHEHSRRRIIVNMSYFLEDKNYDTRKYGERLYKILSRHKNFELYLKKYLDRNKADSLLKSQKRMNKYVT